MNNGDNGDITTVMQSLKNNHFTRVELVEDGGTAAGLVLDIIPEAARVGIGGSTTVRQIGILEQLRKRGTVIINDSN